MFDGFPTDAAETVVERERRAKRRKDRRRKRRIVGSIRRKVDVGRKGRRGATRESKLDWNWNWVSFLSPT